MRLILHILLLLGLCFSSISCGSHGIYFKETEDGVIIRPLDKNFLFFSSKLAPGKYEYSNGEKKASADFKKEPMKLFDLNWNALKE